jgi:hypothetical protein
MLLGLGTTRFGGSGVVPLGVPPPPLPFAVPLVPLPFVFVPFTVSLEDGGMAEEGRGGRIELREDARDMVADFTGESERLETELLRERPPGTLGADGVRTVGTGKRVISPHQSNVEGKCKRTHK